MNIKNKLDSILNSKLAISGAIEAKGISLSSTHLSGYATKISLIQTLDTIKDTTAVSSAVLAGYDFYTSAGIKTTGSILSLPTSTYIIDNIIDEKGYYKIPSSIYLAGTQIIRSEAHYVIISGDFINYNGIYLRSNQLYAGKPIYLYNNGLDLLCLNYFNYTSLLYPECKNKWVLVLDNNHNLPEYVNLTLNADSIYLLDNTKWVHTQTLNPVSNVYFKPISFVTGTKDATATSATILKGKMAYVSGFAISGTIESKLAEVFIPGTSNQIITSGQYLAGDQIISGDTNLKAENIKANTSIFGISGTFTNDANATASKILSGYTAYISGQMITGNYQDRDIFIEVSNTGTHNCDGIYIPDDPNNIIYTPYHRYIDGKKSTTSLVIFFNLGISWFIQDIEGIIFDSCQVGSPRIFTNRDTWDNNIQATFITKRNTTNETALASSLLLGLTAYSQGFKITGTIPIKSTLTFTPTTIDQTINAGYYLSGNQIIKGDSNLKAENIASGISIFGITGTMPSGYDTIYYKCNYVYTAIKIIDSIINDINGIYILTDETKDKTNFDRVWKNTKIDNCYIKAPENGMAGWFIILNNIQYYNNTRDLPYGSWVGTEYEYGDITSLQIIMWDGNKLNLTSGSITYSILSTTELNSDSLIPITGGIYNNGCTKRIYEDTLISSNIAKGVVILGVSGTLTSGTSIDDTTATASTVLAGYDFYTSAGIKTTGTIQSKTALTFIPTTTNQTITAGQYLTEDQIISGDINLKAENIKTNISIFGITGAFTNDANATASKILSGYTAYISGQMITGNYVLNYIEVIGTGTPIDGIYPITDDKILSYTEDFNYFNKNKCYISRSYFDPNENKNLWTITCEDLPLYHSFIYLPINEYPNENTIWNYSLGNSRKVTIYIKNNTAYGTLSSNLVLKNYIGYSRGSLITGSIESLPTSTYIPTTNDQTITSGYYLSGNQIIKGDSNLKAENIASGIPIFGITGTLDTSETYYKCTNVLLSSYTISGIISGTIRNKTVNVKEANGEYILTNYVSNNLPVYNKPNSDWYLLLGMNNYDGMMYHVITNIPNYTGLSVIVSHQEYDENGWLAYLYNDIEGTYTFYGDQAGTPNVKFNPLGSWSGYKLNITSTGIIYDNLVTDGLLRNNIIPITGGIYTNKCIKRIYEDTLISSNIAKGVVILGVSGTLTSGTAIDDTTATASTVLAGYDFYTSAGIKTTGTIQSKTALTFIPTTTNQTITAGQYLAEDQIISGDINLKAENIKTSISIFGITGAFTNDATAVASSILSGYSAYVSGQLILGEFVLNSTLVLNSPQLLSTLLSTGITVQDEINNILGE